MKKKVCITSTPTAYATIGTTIIHHVYKPDFAVCIPFFHDRNWDLLATKSGAVFGLVFFQVNAPELIFKIDITS